jgi:hypothetical protein
VAFHVEVIEKARVNGGELLQGLDVPEARHRSLPSSKGLMRIFGSVVEPTSTHLASLNADIPHRRAVGAQPIGHDGLRPALHRALQNRQGRPAIPAFRGKDLQHLTFVIDGTPEIVHLIFTNTSSRCQRQREYDRC